MTNSRQHRAAAPSGRRISMWLCACAAVLLATASQSAGAARPNLILIVADDLGYGDVGCYGNANNRTPRLDQLAREGMRFTDFHSNGPMCSPTRAALLTGLYQNRFGRFLEKPLSDRVHRHLGLPPEAVTVAEALRGAGYATAMYGKWHLGYGPPHLPTRQGFDDFRGLLTGDGDHHSHVSRSGDEDWWHNEKTEMEDGYAAELITRHSVDFIRQNRDRPFFLYVAHLAIHFPWQGPGEGGHRVRGGDYWDLTKLGQHPPGEVKPVVRQMVEAVDQSVGRIVDTLREENLEDRTLVFFTSDNGGYLDYSGHFRGEISGNGPLRGQKGDVFEGGHRVPAIVRWPGHVPSGAVNRQTTMTMDLMPTFLEVAGVDMSKDTVGKLDGTSLAPVLFEGKSLAPRTLFWRAGDEGAVRRGPWKLVMTGKETLLFNLDDDLGERNDRAGESPELIEQLKAAYRDWEKDVAAGREYSHTR